MTAQAKIQEKPVAEPATTAASASASFLGGAAGVGVLVAVLTIALNPARSHVEMAGMVSASFGCSMFVGPLVIEYLGLGAYSFEAKLGVCFICASVAWLVLSLVSNQLRIWRDSSNPVGRIAKDVSKARKDFRQ